MQKPQSSKSAGRLLVRQQSIQPCTPSARLKQEEIKRHHVCTCVSAHTVRYCMLRKALMPARLGRALVIA